MFNDLKNSLAVTIRFELRKIHPILYSSINKNIFICTWTKCFDRNLQPNYMWNVFSHAFQYCNFGLLNMSALKLLHSTVLNISKDMFNFRASLASFLFLSLEPEKLKVRENQKNDAGISIAILNIPFHYLKLLQLCCLNFPALWHCSAVRVSWL